MYSQPGEAAVRTVTAKTRKRCPMCNKMVEVGQDAVLTDDRWTHDGVSRNHGGAMYRATRGAWHLYHLVCHQEFCRAVAGLVR